MQHTTTTYVVDQPIRNGRDAIGMGLLLRYAEFAYDHLGYSELQRWLHPPRFDGDTWIRRIPERERHIRWIADCWSEEIETRRLRFAFLGVLAENQSTVRRGYAAWKVHCFTDSCNMQSGLYAGFSPPKRMVFSEDFSYPYSRDGPSYFSKARDRDVWHGPVIRRITEEIFEGEQHPVWRE